MSEKSNTILFALRHLQQDMERHPELYEEEGEFGELLSVDEINELCEELNFEVKPRAIVVVCDRDIGYLNDEGVDLEFFDLHKYNDDPDRFIRCHGLIPGRFKDLANQLGVPNDAIEQVAPEETASQSM